MCHIVGGDNDEGRADIDGVHRRKAARGHRVGIDNLGHQAFSNLDALGDEVLGNLGRKLRVDGIGHKR